MNQRHFGRKRVGHCHSTTSFSENVVVAVTSYQILEFFNHFATGKGPKLPNNNNRTNFPGQK